jgi:hypothetical protein
MAAGDLCTLQDVRAFLQKADTDTAQDALIASFIIRASTAIGRWCEREFAPQTAAGVTRLFEVDWDSESYVSFAPYDLASASAVTIDPDMGTGFVLPAAQYRLYPVNRPLGVYTGMKVIPLMFATGPVLFSNRQVSITGTWGFPSVPADVAYATVITVAMWLRQDMSAFGTNVLLDDDGGESGDVLPRMVGAVPPGARTLLAPYRRTAI